MHPILAILGLALPILITGSLGLSLRINRVNQRLVLAFSAAYLFALSIIHMLPEALMTPSPKSAGLLIVLGFCVQLVIDTFSTGIEHGHVHLHSDECHTHLPAGIIIGLFLHSFLEGLPVYSLTDANKVNYQLILGLAVHNIPITLAFATLLKEHGYKGGRGFGLLLGFSLMAPAGYLFSFILQSIGLSGYEAYSRIAYALVIGIFLHISTAILFESSDQHKYNLKKVMVMVLGIIVAYLIS